MGDYTITLKEIDFLKNFKNAIKKWKPELCPNQTKSVAYCVTSFSYA